MGKEKEKTGVVPACGCARPQLTVPLVKEKKKTNRVSTTEDTVEKKVKTTSEL